MSTAVGWFVAASYSLCTHLGDNLLDEHCVALRVEGRDGGLQIVQIHLCRGTNADSIDGGQDQDLGEEGIRPDLRMRVSRCQFQS
jgi:hypothetical protein